MADGVKVKAGGIVLLRRHFHFVDHINFLENGKEIMKLKIRFKSGQILLFTVWNLSLMATPCGHNGELQVMTRSG